VNVRRVILKKWCTCTSIRCTLMMQEDTALCAQQLASKEHGEAEAKRSYGQAFAEALTTGCLDDATRALVACGFSAQAKK
jgi:hypothetical protein